MKLCNEQEQQEQDEHDHRGHAHQGFFAVLLVAGLLEALTKEASKRHRGDDD